MNTLRKVSYYDLREEFHAGKIPPIVGRMEESERLTRVIGRRINNNALIVAPSGAGKSALVYGWLREFTKVPRYNSLHLFQFDADHLTSYEPGSEHGMRFREALEKLPPSILFIDNFGRAIHNNSHLVQQVSHLYNSLLKGSDVRVVLTLEPHNYAWLEREHPAFVQLFETITLKNQTSHENVRVLRQSVPRLNTQYKVLIPTEELQEIVSYAERFPVLGQMPQSAISLLDESISYAGAKGKKALYSEDIAHVVAGKTGIPKTQMNRDDIRVLKTLESDLNAVIVNQENSIQKIAKTLQRGKLGLRNPNKPLGSFLLLGPSGVGKTETAKHIAETMFGRTESFIRFDMSEFQQEHTIQRLIGSPSGYVGYEQGGALTNALRKEPHCLILLDEIEKAHPKVFDIFLQVLDEGRLTSGQNETVDARNAIIMATSNIGVEEILRNYRERTENTESSRNAFIQEKMMPALAKTFRLEFINRFDSILVFNPLTVEGLIQIAQLEIKKIEKRLSKHRVQFDIDIATLEKHIRPIADPRFGARPVKRFIEETCESLLMNSLMSAEA
jgi:ATP-dependent Clp protease ATP-binding subunit ClpA